MKYIFSLIGLLAISSVCNASEIKSLLGVTPGEISKFQGNNIGAPFTTLRLPTVNSSLLEVYPDLKVMITIDTKKIVGVSAERAFDSLANCDSAQNKVRKLLTKAFSSKYTGNDFRWQYQTPDASITAGALCSGSNPYPVLRLDITHTKTNKEILKHFK